MGKESRVEGYTYQVPVSKANHEFIKDLPDKYAKVLRRKMKAVVADVLEQIDNAIELGA